MIHCVCNNINTAKVDEAAHAGACRPKDVLAHHGKAFNCGQCKGSIAERLSCHANRGLILAVSSRQDIALIAAE
ncbi:(2Fe-2S)-binding protein [Robiginitomaculum antarcticum]|uniref:(2Fe-2S)-binding protein n=1 Tax=Robiginitomaculum antarcticum TaxID=437507 RepID=UPI0018F02B14|nr:hypothetical protein [Robiginitomaculum antarcticum]